MMGTATYEGLSAGVYSNSDGDVFQTESGVGAMVNFATRSIEFTTTGTQVNDLSTPPAAFVAQSDLDMTGTLEYEAGSNQFTGPVETTGGMTGTASGVFYGPAAEEIGGTFATQGTGVEAYIGGFGAAQPAAE